MAAGGPFRWAGFALLAFIIGCQIAGIQITLRLIQWSADFYNALQRLDASAAVTQVGIFAALIGTSAGLHLVGSFARQHLQIRWRRRLTDAVLDKWLPAKAYWFLQPSLGGASIDNPDQRIAEDCREFVESLLTKVLDFLISLIGLASFVTLLWQLSTFPLSFELFGIAFEIPRYMVWAAPIYVAIATGIDPCPRPSDAGAACGAAKTRSRFSVCIDALARKRGCRRIVGRRAKRAARPRSSLSGARRQLAKSDRPRIYLRVVPEALLSRPSLEFRCFLRCRPFSPGR